MEVNSRSSNYSWNNFERDPGAVTGYAVGYPDHTDAAGQTIWYGGAKLAGLADEGDHCRQPGRHEEQANEAVHVVLSSGDGSEDRCAMTTEASEDRGRS